MATRTAVLTRRKQRFDIHIVLRRIRAAVTEHADAAMFDLARISHHVEMNRAEAVEKAICGAGG
jgi:hypothetical protein